MVPDNMKNTLVGRSDKWQLPITPKHGHMLVEWGEEENCYTKAELQMLHLYLFHPSVTKLYYLLKRARPQEVNAETRRVLEEISGACTNCHEHRDCSYRFRVSIPADRVKFNHEVAIDLIWMKGNPVLRIVDTQTHYKNAVLLKGESAQDVGNAFIEG